VGHAARSNGRCDFHVTPTAALSARVIYGPDRVWVWVLQCSVASWLSPAQRFAASMQSAQNNVSPHNPVGSPAQPLALPTMFICQTGLGAKAKSPHVYVPAGKPEPCASRAVQKGNRYERS
jgi:hypothetical protein